MYRLLFAFTLLLAAGCGGGSADGLMRSQIAALNDFSAAVESGADQAELKQITDRMQTIASKMAELKPSAAEIERLKKKFEPDLKAATERMQQAMLKRASSGFGFGGAMPGGMF